MAEALPLPDGIPALSDADIAPHLERLVTNYIEDLAYEQTKGKKAEKTATKEPRKVKEAELESNRALYRSEITAQLKNAWAEFANHVTENGTNTSLTHQISLLHDAMFEKGITTILADAPSHLDDKLLSAASVASTSDSTLNRLFNYALITQWVDLRPQGDLDARERNNFLRTPVGELLSETIYALNKPLFESTAVRATGAAFRDCGMTTPTNPDILYAVRRHFYSSLFRYNPSQSSVPFEKYCNGALVSLLPKELLRTSQGIRGVTNESDDIPLSAQKDPRAMTPPDILTGADEQIERTKLLPRAWAAMRQLSSIQREALMARIMPDDPNNGGTNALAKRRGVTSAAVHGHANRALRKLRSELGISEPVRDPPQTPEKTAEIIALRQKIVRHLQVNGEDLTAQSIANEAKLNATSVIPLLKPRSPVHDLKDKGSLSNRMVDSLAKFLSDHGRSEEQVVEFRQDMLELRTLIGYRARGESGHGNGVSL